MDVRAVGKETTRSVSKPLCVERVNAHYMNALDTSSLTPREPTSTVYDSSQTPRFPFRLEKGKDISFAYGSLDIAHNVTVLCRVQELHLDLRHLSDTARGGESDPLMNGTYLATGSRSANDFDDNRFLRRGSFHCAESTRKSRQVMKGGLN